MTSTNPMTDDQVENVREMLKAMEEKIEREKYEHVVVQYQLASCMRSNIPDTLFKTYEWTKNVNIPRTVYHFIEILERIYFKSSTGRRALNVDCGFLLLPETDYRNLNLYTNGRLNHTFLKQHMLSPLHVFKSNQEVERVVLIRLPKHFRFRWYEQQYGRNWINELRQTYSEYEIVQSKTENDILKGKKDDDGLQSFIDQSACLKVQYRNSYMTQDKRQTHVIRTNGYLRPNEVAGTINNRVFMKSKNGRPCAKLHPRLPSRTGPLELYSLLNLDNVPDDIMSQIAVWTNEQDGSEWIVKSSLELHGYKFVRNHAVLIEE